MIIKRKKSAFYTNLGFSITFALLYILLHLEGESFRFIRGLPYIVITCWYIANTIYIYYTPQLAINESSVIHYIFPKKAILIEDITSMDYAAGDYIFRSAHKKSIRITKDQIHPEELEKFEQRFNALKDQIEKRDVDLAVG